MSIINRNGVLVTEKRKVPVLDIMDELCDTRNLDRITTKFPISEDDFWDSLDAFVDRYAVSDSCDICFTKFDHEDLLNPLFALETTAITQEMFTSILRYGRVYVDSDGYNIDRIFQVGLYFIVVEIMESLHITNATAGLTDVHLDVLPGLEEAYQGDLHRDADLFLKSLRDSTAFWQGA